MLFIYPVKYILKQNSIIQRITKRLKVETGKQMTVQGITKPPKIFWLGSSYRSSTYRLILANLYSNLEEEKS